MRTLLLLSLLAGCSTDPSSQAARLPLAELPPPAQPELSLHVSRIQAATTASFTVGGLAAGESVYFLRSMASASPGLCPGVAGGMCLELTAPLVVMGTAIADAAGVARLQLTLPASVPPGREVWFQAAAARGTGGAASVRSPAIRRTTGEAPAADVGDLLPGDLVISEVMQDPTAVSDAAGEWFEVENRSGVDVDLAGLEVGDLGSDRFVVPRSMVVPAGGRAVFGVNDDPATNGGVPVDVEWTSLTLANADDELILTAPGGEIDAIAWDDGLTFPDPSGQSMALDPRHLDADENDDGGLWCAQAGSPGAVNPQCPLPFCGDGAVDPGEQCDDGGTAVGDGCDASCQLEGCPVPEIVTGTWSFMPPGGLNPEITHVVDTASGDLLVVGNHRPLASASVFMARYDGATMNLEWIRQWSHTLLADVPFAVLPTDTDGAAVFARSTYTPTSGTEMWYAEVDAAGDLVAGRTSHEVINGDPMEMRDVDVAADGSYWIVGEVDGYRSYGLRIDTDGVRRQTWDGVLSGAYGYNGAVAVRTLPDGGAVIANHPAWFVRNDAAGAAVWSNALTDTTFVMEDMTTTPDGGLLAVGTGVTGKTMLRIDAAGALLWSRAMTLPAGMSFGLHESQLELVPRTCDAAPTAGATCATDGEWCATTAGTCTCDGVWVCDAAEPEAVLAWHDSAGPGWQLSRVSLDGDVLRTVTLGGERADLSGLWVGKNGEVRATTGGYTLHRLDPALGGSCAAADVTGVGLAPVGVSWVPVTAATWLGRYGEYAWESPINTTVSTPAPPPFTEECRGTSCP